MPCLEAKHDQTNLSGVRVSDLTRALICIPTKSLAYHLLRASLFFIFGEPPRIPLMVSRDVRTARDFYLNREA
jgi:hypothetical protein